MNDIDKYFAEQCGVNLSGMVEGMVIGDEKPSEFVTLGSQWTIQDPRCREIFRNDWLGKGDRRVVITPHSTSYYDFAEPEEYSGRDEEACITAIYEARDE